MFKIKSKERICLNTVFAAPVLSAFICLFSLLNPEAGCAAAAAECAAVSTEEYYPASSVWELPVGGVEVSGPVTGEEHLPWTGNTDFIKTVKSGSANKLIAGYKTVLIDPLPGEEFNVRLAAQKLCGIVVKPGTVFSQNGSIGPYTIDRGFREGPTYVGTKLIKTIGGGVCKISSTLYNVAALCNMEIVERHNHSMPVPYVPYGQDATVAYGMKDFKFRNIYDKPIMIWAQGIENVLYIAFYGDIEPPRVKWVHEVTDIKRAPVNYTINPEAGENSERIVIPGMDGMKVKSWLIVRDNDREYKKFMGNSEYSPMPYLVERGGKHNEAAGKESAY